MPASPSSHVPQPGDPDFDWSTYAQWKAPDPVASAEAFLAAHPTAPADVPTTRPRRTVNGETREWNGQSWVPATAQAPAGVTMYHPDAYETPGDARAHEIERTAAEAAAGLAHSPLDLLAGMFRTVAHPIDTVGGVVRTIAHPVDSAKALMNDPRAAGSALGQLLLGEGIADIPVGKVAASVGRGTGAVGRALETAGTAAKSPSLVSVPAISAALGHPLAAAAEIAAPYAAEFGGRGLQRLSRALESLGETPAPVVDRYMPNTGGIRPRVSREVPGSSYPVEGTAPTPTTAVPAPSLIGQHGFNELPLAQQMDHLSLEGLAPGVVDLAKPSARVITDVPSVPTVPASVDALTSSGPTYANWAQGVDDIVNAAAADGSADDAFSPTSKRGSKADYARLGYTKTPQARELFPER